MNAEPGIEERLQALELRVGGAGADEAIGIILRALRVEVPYDSASVQALRGNRLVIVGGVGFKELDVILGESFDIHNSGSPNGEVVWARRAIVVRDTDQYRSFRRGLHVGAGIRSWLGVPVLDGQDVLGLIALDKAEPDFYTEQHRQNAQRYAALLARRFRATSGYAC